MLTLHTTQQVPGPEGTWQGKWDAAAPMEDHAVSQSQSVTISGTVSLISPSVSAVGEG